MKSNNIFLYFYVSLFNIEMRNVNCQQYYLVKSLESMMPSAEQVHLSFFII